MTVIGYKIADGGDGRRVFVTLEIPSDALTNIGRASVVNKAYAKFRTNKAYVTKIEDQQGNQYKTATTLCYLPKKIMYRVGSIVEEHFYDTNPENICTSGIHFFLTKQAAENYGINIGKNGTFEEWDDNGEPIYTTYRNGIFEESITWWPNGNQRSSHRNFQNGIIFTQIWYDTRVLWAQYMTLHGNIHGLYQSWMPNGQIQSRVEYKNGKVVRETLVSS